MDNFCACSYSKENEIPPFLNLQYWIKQYLDKKNFVCIIKLKCKHLHYPIYSIKYLLSTLVAQLIIS